MDNIIDLQEVIALIDIQEIYKMFLEGYSVNRYIFLTKYGENLYLEFKRPNSNACHKLALQNLEEVLKFCN